MSLFISFLKKCLTNFGNNQFKKTLFYKLWNNLKSKIFINTTFETKLNFEEIKNKINLLETNNKDMLTTQMKEFWNLQQQLIVKFETLLNNITENETISIDEENINNPSNTYSIITNELIKIIATLTTFTAGVAFSSSINIIKNDIANDLLLTPSSFLKTFTSLATIIVSFSALIVFKLKFNLFKNGLHNIKDSLLWQSIKKIVNKSDVSQVNIESELNKITLIKIWYDTNIIELKPNLNEIQKILEISTVNSSSYNATIYQNIKYFFSWLISIISSMAIDSYFYIISAQIGANKKVNFINDLKLLITKDIITAIIAQIGFSFKLSITDFCWEKFKNTYAYQSLSYICSFPKKCYQFVFPNNSESESNTVITEQNLEKLVKEYYQKINTNTTLLTEINNKFNNTLATETTLDVNKINILQLPPLLKTLKKMEKIFFY